MTTIVYHAGVVACDSMAFSGGLTVNGVDKAVISDGKVYIIAGTLVVGHQFIRWAAGDRAGECPINSDSGTEVLEMNLKTGKACVWEGGIPLPIRDKIYALGTGAHLALGAVASGATVEDAIKIACKYDPTSGGKAQVFRSERAKRAGPSP